MASKYTKTITLPNGKRKYIRASTKEELARKYAQVKADMGAGVDVSSDTTVAELAQMWYDLYKKPSLKEGGRRAVLSTVNLHILPELGRMKVRDVKPVHIRRIMAAEAGQSKSLQAKTLQALRGMFRAAVENDLIAKSPVPDSMKAAGTETAEKIPLTVEQSKMLLSGVQGTSAFPCVLLMLTAGLRREEACGLMWSDIDFESGTITVRRAKTFYTAQGNLSEELKSEAAKRTIPISPWAVDALRQVRAKSKSLYVLSKADGSSMTYSAFRRMWGAIETRTTNDSSLLGKPISPRHPNIRYGMDFRVTPHQLRHTCITRWFDAGFDVKVVQYLAGHATPYITVKIYDHYVASVRQQNMLRQVQDSDVLASIAI